MNRAMRRNPSKAQLLQQITNSNKQSQQQGYQLGSSVDSLQRDVKFLSRAILGIPAADAQDGDDLVIGFIGKVDGLLFDGGSSPTMSVELGTKQLIPGFEEQLVGMAVGSTKEIVVTFPEEYGNKKVAGKEATFTVVLHTSRRQAPTTSLIEDMIEQAKQADLALKAAAKTASETVNA